MKKLTIEEKARRYDEALEKASNLRVQNPFDTVSQMMEHIFPELKESEDEKIRKALLEHIQFCTESIPDRDKFIAWLEKQGTPAKLSEEEQNKFAKGVLTSCALSFINYLDGHKYEGKMCVSNGECEDIENAFHNAMWDKLHRYYDKYIEKQECGEAELVMIESIVQTLEKLGDKGANKMKVDFLNSLKDKYTWKPSDEQIAALDFVIDCTIYPEFKDKRMTLKELLEQLKKLMEK